MKVTNTTKAPQAFYITTGQDEEGELTRTMLKLKPGESKDTELDADSVRRIARVRGVIVEGFSAGGGLTDDQISDFAAQMAAMSSKVGDLTDENDTLTDEKTSLEAKLNTANSTISSLQSQLSSANSNISSLNAKIQELETQLAAVQSTETGDDGGNQNDGGNQQQNETVMTGLEAKHKGAGSYSVFDSEGTELVAKLTVEQKDEFNELDDAGKTAWVRKATSSAE